MSSAPAQSTQIDARREPRYNVYWRGRLQLADGRWLEMRVKDISGSGMGLMVAEAVPQGAMLPLVVRVPDPNQSAQNSEVSGTAQVAYVALRGYEFAVGVVWVDRSDDGRERMSRWIGRLRHFI